MGDGGYIFFVPNPRSGTWYALSCCVASRAEAEGAQGQPRLVFVYFCGRQLCSRDGGCRTWILRLMFG